MEAMADETSMSKWTGRFVCLDCKDDLTCVRIGLWRCPHCGHTGVVGVYPFNVVRVEHGHVGEDLSTPELFARYPREKSPGAEVHAR